ncbi:MAG: hypothetical protein ACRC6R_06045 [Bacteroidales bacterium]
MTTKIPVFASNDTAVKLDSERKVLIDGDIFRYQMGAIQMKHPFLDELVPAESSVITRMVDDLIVSICNACGSTNYIVFLSGKDNFRNEVAKQVKYKGNRNPNQTRPYHFDTVGDHLEKSHPFKFINGKEADDEMGSTQREDFLRQYFGEDFDIDKLNYIIASRDKDLRTVPGLHYSWACGKDQPEKPLYYIPVDKAKHMFFYQMLIGDNTDNIMGCGVKLMTKWGFEKDEKGEFLLDEEGKKIPHMMLRRKGVGDKTAKKILAKCKTVRDMKAAVIEEYKKVFKEDFEEIMLENAKLLYIGQEPDNQFDWSWIDYALDHINTNYEDTPND